MVTHLLTAGHRRTCNSQRLSRHRFHMMLDQQKALARQRAKRLRKDLNLPQAPQALARWADDLYRLGQGGPVAGYAPFGSELDVGPLMLRLQSMGCDLALPLIVAPHQPLEFHLWQGGDPLQAGPLGIFQPAPHSPIIRPALVLAPLLAFDRQGWRLGYGGGYYDRTLDALGTVPPVTVVGIAFAAQEMDCVPHQPHDHPVDYVATETELIRI